MNVGINWRRPETKTDYHPPSDILSLTLIFSMERAGGGGFSFNRGILFLHKLQRENFASHSHPQPFAEIGSQILLFFSNPGVCISKTLSSGVRSCKNNARYELTGASAERQDL